MTFTSKHRFHSIVVEAEKEGARWAEFNDPRITLVGKFICKSRIYELPQLWNDFKTKMSLKEPKPERLARIQLQEKVTPYCGLHHHVMPGITEWAQAMRPYSTSVEEVREKLHFDLFYIKNFRAQLDFGMLMGTMRIFLIGKGR